MRENLLLCSSHLLLGFPTGRSFTSSTPRHQQVFWHRCRGNEEEALMSTTLSHVNYAPAKRQASFLVLLPGKKKISAGGVLHTHPLLCFKFCFTLFLLASFYQKHTKISILFSCYFITFSSLCCSLSTFWRTSQ
jgi:hypothetical protein